MQTNKTLKQIQAKANQFKNSLKGKTITENFGEDKVRNLNDYVGSIYDYDYLERMEVINILQEFDNWCETYCITGTKSVLDSH